MMANQHNRPVKNGTAELPAVEQQLTLQRTKRLSHIVFARMCPRLAAVTMGIKFVAMIRLLLIAALAATILSATACKTNEGSREYIPGRGWVPTPN